MHGKDDDARLRTLGANLPYGIEPNRQALAEIVGFATAQGILTKPVSIEELFAPSVRGLTG